MVLSKLFFLEISDGNVIEPFDQIVEVVSARRRERIKNTKCIIDKKLSLYSEIIVRDLICSNLKISNKRIDFCYSKYGKPYLSESNFHFNISHTRNAVVVAISDVSVGIDIERIGRYNSDIAMRCYTKNEHDYLHEVSDIEAQKRFYEIWTRKEAYTKYTGEGLLKPFHSFDVLDKDDIYTFVEGSYVISVCDEHYDPLEKITILDENDIQEMVVRLINLT